MKIKILMAFILLSALELRANYFWDCYVRVHNSGTKTYNFVQVMYGVEVKGQLQMMAPGVQFLSNPINVIIINGPAVSVVADGETHIVGPFTGSGQVIDFYLQGNADPNAGQKCITVYFKNEYSYKRVYTVWNDTLGQVLDTVTLWPGQSFKKTYCYPVPHDIKVYITGRDPNNPEDPENQPGPEYPSGDPRWKDGTPPDPTTPDKDAPPAKDPGAFPDTTDLAKEATLRKVDGDIITGLSEVAGAVQYGSDRILGGLDKTRNIESEQNTKLGQIKNNSDLMNNNLNLMKGFMSQWDPLMTAMNQNLGTAKDKLTSMDISMGDMRTKMGEIKDGQDKSTNILGDIKRGGDMATNIAGQVKGGVDFLTNTVGAGIKAITNAIENTRTNLDFSKFTNGIKGASEMQSKGEAIDGQLGVTTSYTAEKPINSVPAPAGYGQYMNITFAAGGFSQVADFNFMNNTYLQPFIEFFRSMVCWICTLGVIWWGYKEIQQMMYALNQVSGVTSASSIPGFSWLSAEAMATIMVSVSVAVPLLMIAAFKAWVPVDQWIRNPLAGHSGGLVPVAAAQLAYLFNADYLMGLLVGAIGFRITLWIAYQIKGAVMRFLIS